MSDLLMIVIAVFIPPLAVFLKVGIRGPFWLNILLTIFFAVPGMIHALWIVMKKG